MQLSFTISKWSGWQQSSNNKASNEIVTSKTPDVSAIPAMLRRRLNTLGRACANEIIKHIESANNHMPIVYCSQHGDIERTLKILTELTYGEAVSPKDFSLAVHNAICGVLSIHLKSNHNISTISAGSNGLVPALLESVGILADGATRVLCILGDVRLPKIYFDQESLPLQAYVIGLTIQKKQGMPVKLSLDNKNTNTASHSCPMDILSFLQSNKQSLYLPHNSQRWALKKPGNSTTP